MAGINEHIDIGRLLFETGAIRVAPDDKPFWYTSGTIGPYYSNTQNLIGSEAAANALLGLIDAWLGEDRLSLPGRVTERVREAYEKNACYRSVAGYIKDCVNNNIGADSFDIISGGARRDWFFSYIAAVLLNKPHLTIFKDLSAALGGPGAGGANVWVRDGELEGVRCLHISDIVTEASSYEKAWLPAIAKTGANINASMTILDRRQGGRALLKSLGVELFSISTLDAPFFDRALRYGYISVGQHGALIKYLADPKPAMELFLQEHPEFLKNALAAGGKEAERARACIESGAYRHDGKSR